MSVIVRGMEMPNNCQECTCINGEHFYCQAVGRKPQDENIISRRPDWCPIADVPTPHGRLIDADLLSKILKKRAEDEWNKNTAPFSWSYAYECLIDTLDIMPTIIEAEAET